MVDRVVATNASHLLTDGPAQRLFLVENGIAGPCDIRVLAEGSIAGVDTERFKYCRQARDEIRASLNIREDAVVFLYLGRLTVDKGVQDLSRAFSRAAARNELIHLLVVGPDEEDLELEFANPAERLAGRVHRLGFTDQPEAVMSAADCICLPSYREGFNNVVIEAAAVGLPSIASRIYGITDAVEEGVTGILHPPGSECGIMKAMLLLASDQELRRRMGEAARKRVTDKFPQALVTKAFAEFYYGLLSENKVGQESNRLGS
jgi:glycosyltransferase involved in cell wall biosynthesis